MAHPLFWPGQYYFYPIGNTSAVSLTRDLPLEEPADILLLGCGDPRNVLYTIFCEPKHMNRPLDFTCCDVDPGVLARNVLLLTMMADNQHKPSVIWNIYFHMYLDANSLSTLVKHCNKLVTLSGSLQDWNASVYGPFIKMCTEYTLAELRRHWTLYIHMQDISPQRMKELRNAFTTVFEPSSVTELLSFSACRASGPLYLRALPVIQEHCLQYWKTGVTFADPQLKASTTLLNPTFVYSLAGEGCSVHYAIDPLASFHLAAHFGNANGSGSVPGAVTVAMAEFDDWCFAFHTSTTPTATCVPVIRFFLGEATAVCSVISSFASTGTLVSSVPVAQWNAQVIQLNKVDYQSNGAPSLFNVIDTSNLNDHLGLLNVLIISVPLLSTSTPLSVLYTESLLFEDDDASKEFAKHLHANITVISLLLGICPVDYLSSFATRSNLHELLLFKSLKEKAGQFHQVTTWKSPTSGDPARREVLAAQKVPPPFFNPRQLGTLFYDMYHQLFEEEDARKFLEHNMGNLLRAYTRVNLVHYTRESFVLFVKLVKEHLSIPDQGWQEIMDCFFDLANEDQTLLMDKNNRQELYAQFHHHCIYTAPFYHQEKLPKIGRFVTWDNVPPLVQIILVVPHQKLAVFDTAPGETASTPPLQCELKGNQSYHIFTTVQTAFGRVSARGTKSNPQVVFEEDSKKQDGSSPLVVSFTMPTRLLTLMEPMENLHVCLSIRSNAGTVGFMKKLGMAMDIFRAKLTDESAVYILPESRIPPRKLQPNSLPTTKPGPTKGSNIGALSAIEVELDEQCELAVSFTGRVIVGNAKAQTMFRSGAMPKVTQTSPTIMKITLGHFTQYVPFPFPVIGSQNKVRLARKSLYIEVIVPIFGPSKADGMKLNPFPIVKIGQFLNPWNIHHINLSQSPVLNMKAMDIEKWLNPHIGSMFSSQERRSPTNKKRQVNTLTYVKDTIHTIFGRFAGIQGVPMQNCFALRDKATTECDTIFFIGSIRFDLQCHAMVCDAYVLPLTPPLMSTLRNDFTTLVNQGNIHNTTIYEGESETWKMLLPTLVERCRTSWKHTDRCEYRSQGRIPLSVEMHKIPICSCGRGKDVEGMMNISHWRGLAPFVTRLALSPLFAVSYLEAIGRDPARYMCFVCRGKGKPKLLKCATCQKTRYCSKGCQKKDWKIHKLRCKPQ